MYPRSPRKSNADSVTPDFTEVLLQATLVAAPSRLGSPGGWTRMIIVMIRITIILIVIIIRGIGPVWLFFIPYFLFRVALD